MPGGDHKDIEKTITSLDLADKFAMDVSHLKSESKLFAWDQL